MLLLVGVGGCLAFDGADVPVVTKAAGVDAWSDERAQEYLGSDYIAADYERVTDILDVWFDSGCTHAFVLESGRWAGMRWPASHFVVASASSSRSAWTSTAISAR